MGYYLKDLVDVVISSGQVIDLGDVSIEVIVAPGHCSAYASKDAVSFIDQSRAEIEWIYHSVLQKDESPNTEDESLFRELFN